MVLSEIKLSTMTDAKELEDARNAALRKIGRNVVNFQKIELMLKYLNAHGTLEGNVSELRLKRNQSIASTDKQTLGALAKSFVEFAYENGSERVENLELFPEVWLSISLKIESNAKLAEVRKEALLRVVEERNKRIHHLLADFDSDSFESCTKLSAELDDQNRKLFSEFKFLRSLADFYRAGAKELVDRLSPEISNSEKGEIEE